MKQFSVIITIISLALAGCEYDNFAEPESVLSGRVIFEGKPVGVRTDGPQLELWQDGHALRTLIPVHIKYDGTYSAVLFDGQYKLVRKGDSPWLQQASDTILVNVKGNTMLDVPVTPYFTLTDESFQRQNNQVTARFKVNKIVDNANLDVVRLFFSKNKLVDNAKLASQSHRVDADKSTIVLGQQSTLVAQVPEDLRGLGYVFVRLGVKSNLTGEYYYSPEQRIDLN